MASSYCLSWHTLEQRLMGSSSSCFIVSSFFPLQVGCPLEEWVLIAVLQNDFQSRPVWISFRASFQGCVACPQTRGLWLYFPGSQRDFLMGLLYLSWTSCIVSPCCMGLGFIGHPLLGIHTALGLFASPPAPPRLRLFLSISFFRKEEFL